MPQYTVVRNSPFILSLSYLALTWQPTCSGRNRHNFCFDLNFCCLGRARWFNYFEWHLRMLVPDRGSDLETTCSFARKWSSLPTVFWSFVFPMTIYDCLRLPMDLTSIKATICQAMHSAVVYGTMNALIIIEYTHTCVPIYQCMTRQNQV